MHLYDTLTVYSPLSKTVNIHKYILYKCSLLIYIITLIHLYTKTSIHTELSEYLQSTDNIKGRCEDRPKIKNIESL